MKNQDLPSVALLLAFVFADEDVVMDTIGFFNSIIRKEQKERRKQRIRENPLRELYSKEKSLDGALALFSIYNSLSQKSRALKITECKSKPIDEEQPIFQHVPLSLDFTDCSYWARNSIWSPIEAAMLSVGLTPTAINIKSIEKVGKRGRESCKLLIQLFERKRLIEQSIASDKLGANGNPVELVNWFEQLEYEFPAVLGEAVRKFQIVQNAANPKNEKAWERERESLLRLVAAMGVKGYRFDPALKRNTVTADIRSDLELLGFSMDDKTILKWLRIATDLVDKTYWDKS